MKRILNLNDFSAPALKIIAIIAVGLPAALWLASYVSGLLGQKLIVLGQLALAFMEVGGVLLLLFFALIVLEQIQDHALYQQYLRERGKQVEGECPFCGNRQLHSFEHFCPVCGKKVEHIKR